MKATLLPVYFPQEKTERFETQLERLRTLLGEVAEFLPPQPIDAPAPNCDAVVFPEIVGEAYRRTEDFRRLPLPFLIATSEFGTLSMWDWEVINFLKVNNLPALAPYNLEQARLYCRMLAMRGTLRGGKFLVFQDNPGDGFQPEIFKSFFWWGEGCTRAIEEKFGLTIERRSLKKLGKDALAIPDSTARDEWEKHSYPASSTFTQPMAINAMKLYLALRAEIDSDNIIGMGTNCLNESRSCCSTPCLAWDRLLEERGIIWACEGDTLSLATMCLVRKSFLQPLLMTNIYPFLMGLAATKHEKIPGFPEFLPNPDDHILLAHCGYFGLVPRSFSEQWVLREKALAIVDPNAHVFDARLKTGPLTLVKLDASLSKLMVVKAELKGYIQYDSSSDCRNGGIVQVEDGKRFMSRVYSHHIIVCQGDISSELDALGMVMGLEVEHF